MREMLAGLAGLYFGLMAAGMGLFFTFGIYALTCIGLMRMFEKAGLAGWKAWVPFYRRFLLARITMGHGWYFFFMLIPLLVPVVQVLYAVEVTLSYGAGPVFAILYYFLPVIGEWILGFGDYPYVGSQNPEEQVKKLFQAGKRKAAPESKAAGGEQAAPDNKTPDGYAPDGNSPDGNGPDSGAGV